MLRPGRFFWKLFLGNALLMALVLAVCTALIVWEVENLYLADLTERLDAQAEQVCYQLQDRVGAGQAGDLDKVAKDLGRLEAAHIRVTVIAPDGHVWADSEADPAHMENHSDRPEFAEALRSGRGVSERFSRSVGRDMRYVARRVGPADKPLAVVRVSMARAGIEARAGKHRRLIGLFGCLGLIAVLLVSLVSAAVWSGPIRRITEVARNLSRGNLVAKADVGGSDEIAEVARSLERMRASLAQQLQTIDRQRRNQDYLIRSLGEGVILAGADGRIALMNPSAVRLLRLAGGDGSVAVRFRSDGVWSGDAYVGQRVEACIPSRELQGLLLEPGPAAVISPGGGDDAPVRRPESSRELRLQVDTADGPIALLARSSAIELANPDADTRGGQSGRLVVLTDITELTRTIQIKTDFVANASHELRTPLSAIRGSVETLMQMDLRHDAPAAMNFIGMIDRHSGRLADIVGDLLDLSRLESPGARFPAEDVRMPDLLEETRTRFATPLSNKPLEWRVDCPVSAEPLRVSPQLLRLVLDNLVENAIKFTEPGGFVAVVCRRNGDEYRIDVVDNGCGIPLDDQVRVFERFYQVERARSGSSGRVGNLRGTGLGLSIVRHAVAGMNGRVELRSRVGEGTTVSVLIPQAALSSS